MKRVLVLFLLICVPFSIQAGEVTEVSVEEILRKVDDMFRQEHSIMVMEMHVKTERYERTMKMRAMSLGTEKSLITILEPAKEAGTATLKVGDNIWNYLPKVDRTMKLPSGMMGGSWMGSHFSNDDLVKENRFSEDFAAKVTSTPETSAEKIYVIEMVPKEDTAIVWGKIISRSRADLLPLDVQYFDEDGTLMRIDKFEDIKDFGGVLMPTRFSVLPQDKPGESTTITYLEIDFVTPVTEKEFSLQALRK
jgi:outer membrane lipoprotein-sorting protein